MAHLIKLESGQYLNLDLMGYTDYEWNEDGIAKDPYAHIVGGAVVELSLKDLEKIDQIVAKGEYDNTIYRVDGDSGDLIPLSYEEVKRLGLR